MAEHEARELHPVATDQPGIILHNPKRKLRQIAIVYALLPLLCGATGAWVSTQTAYHRSSEHTDGRIGTLEADLAERRATRDRENAERDAQDRQRDAQTRELLVLVCVLLDRAQPRDAEVQGKRLKYGCTGGPYTAPQPTPAPPSATSGPARPRPPRGTPDSGSLPPRRVDPAPTPAPPAPRPTPPDGAPGGGPLLGCLDLPLLPEICL